MDVYIGFLLVWLPFIWMTVSGAVDVMTWRPPRGVQPALPPARVGRSALPTRERDWWRLGKGLLKVLLGVPVVMFTGLIFMWGTPSDLVRFIGDFLALATFVLALDAATRRARQRHVTA